MDDLYKNLKIYEAKVMGSSSTTQNTQNVDFVSSNNTDSTNKAVSTAHGVFAASYKTNASNLPNKRVKKLEGKKKKRTHGLERIYKVGLSVRIVSSNEIGLDDQEDASKQGRIAEIDADEDLSLINETAQDPRRMNDQDLFGVNDIDGDEVIVDVIVGEMNE
nr:hypothetical protein [Tanacetum cinerariifolium]